MSVELTRVVVLDEGLYHGTGLVHRWLVRAGNRLYQHIVHEAPERSGELKAGIELDFTQGPGLRVISAYVTSTAPHTGYVLGGTAHEGTGWIYRNAAAATSPDVARVLAGGRVDGRMLHGMWMRFSNPYPPRTFALRVRGQRSNNFMARGYNHLQRTHRSMHPFPE